MAWSEKAMAPHSSTLAWRIPWMEEPGRLQSMGSQTVRHDWATSLSLFTFKHWRRKWQPTPMFLPGESQGRRSLVGCHLWGRTESDTIEATWQQQQHVAWYSQVLSIRTRLGEAIMLLTTERKLQGGLPLLFPSALQDLIDSSNDGLATTTGDCNSHS